MFDPSELILTIVRSGLPKSRSLGIKWLVLFTCSKLMFVAAKHPGISRMVRIIRIINPFVFFPPDRIYFLALSTFHAFLRYLLCIINQDVDRYRQGQYNNDALTCLNFMS